LQLAPAAAEPEVSLLTGGEDRHYAFGLTMALVANGVRVEFVGSDEIDSPELHATDRIRFLNLRGNQRLDASLCTKVLRVLAYYGRLIRYVRVARPRVLHILWNNKFQTIDRTLLMLYYKLLGKRVALTAHNVNAGRRDSRDTLLNRITLGIQYKLTDRIFVHTDRMKAELISGFGVRDSAVTVIPYGINNAVPDTDLTPAEAKDRLGIRHDDRTILFFGSIAPYKGLEYLVDAFERLVAADSRYRLVIAGRPKKHAEEYWKAIESKLERPPLSGRILRRIQYIADEDAEMYFKAADVLVLPYTDIFQSGVMFFGYSFGIPTIVSDVGSLKEDVVEGRTGFVVRPRDSGHLADTLERYFSSSLFAELDRRRRDIRDFAQKRHSWDTVGRITSAAYSELSRK
jgi:glycosyltransferase involved in cell wall biosynthesis